MGDYSRRFRQLSSPETSTIVASVDGALELSRLALQSPEWSGKLVTLSPAFYRLLIWRSRRAALLRGLYHYVPYFYAG